MPVFLGASAIGVYGDAVFTHVLEFGFTSLKRAELTKVVGTGAMGGFTTFSTACVESARLLLDPKAPRNGRLVGVLHGVGMLVGAVLLAALGYAVGA